jgi:hypothetical protein
MTVTINHPKDACLREKIIDVKPDSNEHTLTLSFSGRAA